MILFGLARRTARNSRKYHYFTVERAEIITTLRDAEVDGRAPRAVAGLGKVGLVRAHEDPVAADDRGSRLRGEQIPGALRAAEDVGHEAVAVRVDAPGPGGKALSVKLARLQMRGRILLSYGSPWTPLAISWWPRQVFEALPAHIPTCTQRFVPSAIGDHLSPGLVPPTGGLPPPSGQ